MLEWSNHQTRMLPLMRDAGTRSNTPVCVRATRATATATAAAATTAVAVDADITIATVVATATATATATANCHGLGPPLPPLPSPPPPFTFSGSSEKGSATDTAVVRNLRRKLNADGDDGGGGGGAGLPMLHGGGSDVSNATNSKKQGHGHGQGHQDRSNKRVLVRLKLETRHGYTALGDPADPVVEKLGSFSATTNTNLAMLRLMISQTPSLSVPLEFTFLHPPPGTVGASYDPTVHGVRGFGRRASSIQVGSSAGGGGGGGGRKTIRGGGGPTAAGVKKAGKKAKGVPLYGELVTHEEESNFELRAFIEEVDKSARAQANAATDKAFNRETRFALAQAMADATVKITEAEVEDVHVYLMREQAQAKGEAEQGQGPGQGEGGSVPVKAAKKGEHTHAEGIITIKTLMAAFRRARRARANMKEMRRGKELVQRMHNLINETGLTIVSWFNKMDGAGAADANGGGWCGVVWCGGVGWGVVWRGVVWCGVVWCGGAGSG